MALESTTADQEAKCATVNKVVSSTSTAMLKDERKYVEYDQTTSASLCHGSLSPNEHHTNFSLEDEFKKL